jgi:hypothetical protein
MKITTTYRRTNPSSIAGDTIVVTTTYSSFNQQEIDDLEEKLKAQVGYCLIQEDANE